MAKKSVEVSMTPALPVIELALKDIQVNEDKNLRRFPPTAQDIVKLANSIRDIGLLNPVTVRPVHHEGEMIGYELVAGYQRMKAIKYLSENGMVIEKVPATVKDSDDQTARKANLDENQFRTDLSYIDSSYAIREMQQKDGMTKQEIAKRMGKSGAWVTYVERLLDLRPEVQKKIHEGKIPWRVARDLPELSEEEQDKAIAIAEAGDRKGAEASAKKSKGGRKSNRGRKAREDQADARGISTKQATAQLDELVKEISEKDKYSKTEGAAMELYTDLSRFLRGAFGVKALHNRILKLL